jgi:hypothetical protein
MFTEAGFDLTTNHFQNLWEEEAEEHDTVAKRGVFCPQETHFLTQTSPKKKEIEFMCEDLYIQE